MKLDLSFNMKLDTSDRQNAVLSTHHLGTKDIQPLSASHRRKGSRKKSKPPTVIQRILQATRGIPADVLGAFLTALFTALPKVLLK